MVVWTQIVKEEGSLPPDLTDIVIDDNRLQGLYDVFLIHLSFLRVFD